MIKFCKQKAIDRWSKFGQGVWYVWNLSFFVSVYCLIYGSFYNIPELVFFGFINTMFSGFFSLVAYDATIYYAIKERQKLFGWDESC